jgi:hypothetical protein
MSGGNEGKNGSVEHESGEQKQSSKNRNRAAKGAKKSRTVCEAQANNDRVLLGSV